MRAPEVYREAVHMKNIAAFVLLLPFPVVLPGGSPEKESFIETVRGPLDPARLGPVLSHEHILVDFIGAEKASRDRYDPDEVVRVVLPHLRALKERGCGTIVDCTPAYLGRDPELLARLSKSSGLHILTNTGYYGAMNDKFLPRHAFQETADQLCARWVKEHRGGIEGSGIRPGFIKIGVDSGPLSAVDRKLVVAAARCHLKTGLTICVHTGKGASLEIIETLKAERVSPSAYVWVHAQNEKDRSVHLKAAREGAWLEFDGLSPTSLDGHVRAALDLIQKGHIEHLLFSHDAGWYSVGEERGGSFRGYTFLFESFLPALRRRGITDSQIETLVVKNPARAFSGGIRKLR